MGVTFNCLSDIDECAAPVDPCEAVANSKCKNIDGAYICQCEYGFRKNGSVCEGEFFFNNVDILHHFLLVSKTPG